MFRIGILHYAWQNSKRSMNSWCSVAPKNKSSSIRSDKFAGHWIVPLPDLPKNKKIKSTCPRNLPIYARILKRLIYFTLFAYTVFQCTSREAANINTAKAYSEYNWRLLISKSMQMRVKTGRTGTVISRYYRIFRLNSTESTN